MNLYAFFPYIFQTTMRPLVFQFLKFFCNLEIRGLENIKKIDGNFILASNHLHELDGFLIPATIPLSIYQPPIFPVSRTKDFYKDKRLRSHFYGGWFFKFMGAHPAYGGLKNYKAALVKHTNILEDGHSILIFPQGKAKKEMVPERAKGGVGFLVNYTQKPVVPVRIEGIYGMNFWDVILRRKQFKITFQEPLYPSNLFPDNKQLASVDYKEAAVKIMNAA